MNIESNPYQSPESNQLDNGLNLTEASIDNNRKTASDMFRLGVIATEVFPPTSGFIRYGALAATQLHTTNPLTGAAVLGLTTLGLEWGSYRAAVGWIAENKMSNVLDGIRNNINHYRSNLVGFKSLINEKTPRLKLGRIIPNIPKVPATPEHGTTLPKVAQTLIALELGTVALLSVKQEMNRSRGIEINKRDARIAIAGVTGFLALQGAAISTGVEMVKKDTELGLTALSISAIAYAAWKYGHKKIKDHGNSIDHER